MADASGKTVGTKSSLEDSSQAANDLSVMIDSLLTDMTEKFTSVTAELTAKMDDMGRRIDSLEASLQAQKPGAGSGTSTPSQKDADS